ncbi:MAG: hypothetical protein WAV92_03570, partial [Halopseudomonas yangmingensis]
AKHYELATFSTGKQYNCDLNASYNIAARYWAWKLKLTRRNGRAVAGGQKLPRQTENAGHALNALAARAGSPSSMRSMMRGSIHVFPPLPIEPVRVYQALTHWPGYSSTRL